MNKRKPNVGDKLVRVIQSSYGRSAPTRQTVVVYKVGRKHFSVGTEEAKDDPRRWSTHHVDSWLEKDSYAYRSIPLYENEQEIRDEEESMHLTDLIDQLDTEVRRVFPNAGTERQEERRQ